MASKNRHFSFQHRLSLLLMGLALAMTACFIVFQYQREKTYKQQQTDARLQLFNIRIIDEIADNGGASMPQSWQRHTASLRIDGQVGFDDIRVTILDLEGKVLFDNTLDSGEVANHLDRPEIAQAVVKGTGVCVRRQSETTDKVYFYSAMRGDSIIVRSAVPYTLTFEELMRVDRTFLWFMLGVALVVCLIGYLVSRRIGHSIKRLRDFASHARAGGAISDDPKFPSDELGSISHDIVTLYSKLQRAGEDLRAEHQQTLHQEQEKIRIKKELTNNINHELKTPVASICLCLETILTHPEIDDKKRDEFIHRCHDNALRLSKLLMDVGTITRLDEGGSTIEKENLDLVEVVKGVIGDLPVNSFHILTTMPEKAPIVGNGSLLASIFRNLFDNAIAYSGGDTISVTILPDARRYIVEVADNGCGVDEAKLPHIFERFYRVDKGRSRAAGGTGLGLSIVKNAVALHGGVVSASNQNGLLVTFTLNQ